MSLLLRDWALLSPSSFEFVRGVLGRSVGSCEACVLVLALICELCRLDPASLFSSGKEGRAR